MAGEFRGIIVTRAWGDRGFSAMSAENCDDPGLVEVGKYDQMLTTLADDALSASGVELVLDESQPVVEKTQHRLPGFTYL